MREKVKRPIAIVIGRNYSSRLGMIRAAGMAGCDVVVIQTNAKSHLPTIDDKSKYVIECKSVPEPDKRGLINVIKSYKDEEKKPILIPTDDYAASTIDEYLDDLAQSFLLPNINNKQGAIIKLMDKFHQKELATKAGLNVANGWICYYSKGTYCIPEDIKYPCFVKPQDASQGHLKKYLKKCEDKESLIELLNRIGLFFKGPILVEEYHKIDKEYAVVGVSIEGNSTIPAVILMEKGWAGVTAVGRIFPISNIPNLEHKLHDFMKQTNLTGLFDFDLYESDKQFFFNEFNARFGANGFALTYSGINLPALLINHLLTKEDKANSDTLSKEYSFVNENFLRYLYDEKKISYCQYRKTIKQADILSIQQYDDLGPYSIFRKTDLLLPILRIIKELKKYLPCL